MGSDLDIVLIVATSDISFEERGREFDTRELPVPADILVYTLAEWHGLNPEEPFGRRLRREAVWVYGNP